MDEEREGEKDGDTYAVVYWHCEAVGALVSGYNVCVCVCVCR